MKNSDINQNRTNDKAAGGDANRDPITGAPGAHPVGTGVGSAGGGATGAAIGAAVGGPVGAVIGLAVGAIAGGLAGKGAAEAVNPTVEDAYWKDNYSNQPWVERNRSYDDYKPAFKTGYEGYAKHGTAGKSWDDAETDLRTDYERSKSKSGLEWEKAKAASRAAWQRVESPVENNRVTGNTPKAQDKRDANRDPLSGAPGAHPVGAGAGAAAGAASGAAIGAIGGPIGAAVGLVAGGIAGGLAGKGVAEAVNPTREGAYWKSNYATQSWYDKSLSYDDYDPAFKTGYEGYGRYAGTGKTYDQVENDLRSDYERSKGSSRLGWEKAKVATRAAWHRVERALPGDADGDGR